jgi:hypothetical protein
MILINYQQDQTLSNGCLGVSGVQLTLNNSEKITEQ